MGPNDVLMFVLVCKRSSLYQGLTCMSQVLFHRYFLCDLTSWKFWVSHETTFQVCCHNEHARSAEVAAASDACDMLRL